MTAEIRVFVSRMLDVDRAMADHATPGPWRYNDQNVWIPKDDQGRFVVGMREEYVAAGPQQKPICVAATGPSSDAQSMMDARFIAYMDPSRLAASIASKTRLLDAHKTGDRSGTWSRSCMGCGLQGPNEWPVTDDLDECPVLRAIASEYRYASGFQDRWLNDN